VITMNYCRECGRSEGGRWIACPQISAYLDGAREYAKIVRWDPNDAKVVANIASMFRNRGYPAWYRPIAERISGQA
jgi:hypothetical protein